MNSFFRPRGVTLMSMVTAMAVSMLLITGCSRSVVRTNFETPEFKLADLRTAPSVLLISPEVRVTGFKKSYDAVFQDSTALPARLSQKILDSLKLKGLVTMAPAGTGTTDSALLQLLASTGSKHIIFVRRITIEDTLLEIEDVLLPGPGAGSMQPTRGGTGKACIVNYEVEVLDSALAKRYAFSVWAKADVPLYAYKSTLLNALDAAARKTAKHLSGN